MSEVGAMIVLVLLYTVSSVFTNTLRDTSVPWNRFQRNVDTIDFNSEELDGYHNVDSEGRFQVSNELALYDLMHNGLRNKKINSENKYEKINKLNSIETQCKLTKALEELTKVLIKALDVAKQNGGNVFRPLHDVIQPGDDKNRLKRESKDETVIYDLKKNKKDTSKERVSTTDKNIISKHSKENNATDNKENIDKPEKNGRRMYTDTNPIVNSQVKETLLRYINEGFREIENKIASLDNLKTAFSTDGVFRIGYIVSTLDTLDANMKNLNRDMNRNKHLWSDQRILSLYDIIRTANNAVGSLLDVLKSSVGATLI